MAGLNIKSLVKKLNTTCQKRLEDAIGLCLARTNHDVEIEHWIVKLLEDSNSDIPIILSHFDIDPAIVQQDILKAIDKMRRGNNHAPGLSPYLVKLAKESWVTASVEFSVATGRSAHLFIALLADESLNRLAMSMSEQFMKIEVETLKKQLMFILKNSNENSQEVSSAAPAASGTAPGAPQGGPSSTQALDQFCIDLTAKAKTGDIDPVLGRDHEIRQVIDILTRRRQNNPIMTGEAGVGKTAVVEGFALRIAEGDVPESLKNVSIRMLDLGLLQAGAGVKGEFENRLKQVIEEVKSSPQPIIMFIDEAHTMIGAGGAAGQNDAANLLKPALARGELRTVAATTWAEYKKYFEKDPALTRRFQVVKVEEPSEPSAVQMMRGVAGVLSKHHNVRIMDEAIIDSVALSSRYIAGRQLPDKSISLLDTACARVNISQAATPAPLEEQQRIVERLTTEIDILNREAATGVNHQERLDELGEEKAAAEKKIEELTERWEQEKELIGKINEIATKLGDATSNDAVKAEEEEAQTTPSPEESQVNIAELQEQLNAAKAELKELQGEEPLVHLCVDSQTIAEIIGNWTGIPVGRMQTDEIKSVLNLKDELEKRVVGQPHALEAISKSIYTSRAKLTDPRRPIGVFFLTGPSGVGKTETALALTEQLYGNDSNITVINMSEFKEEHKVSMLVGSPPGYVGYGEGGVLTEAVRRKPYSVILLDEMEKAHPGVQDIFYQVFDKGMLKDGEGRDIDFKNTIIIMTSNAGTDLTMKLCADPETMPDAEGLTTALKPELLNSFKPAFLGRVNIVPYLPLTDEILADIARLQVGLIINRVKDNYQATLTVTENVINHIVSRCTEVDSGARNIHNILNNTLLPELSVHFLERMASEEPMTKAIIDIDENDNFTYTIK